MADLILPYGHGIGFLVDMPDKARRVPGVATALWWFLSDFSEQHAWGSNALTASLFPNSARFKPRLLAKGDSGSNSGADWVSATWTWS